MLTSEPSNYPEVSKEILEVWKSLGPLSIQEIMDKSKIDFNLNDPDIEFKKEVFSNRIAIGMFKKGT
jgi:hypothetical protein